MSKDWIIEVLADLRGFASANGLPNLAAQLEEVQVIALVELAQPAAGTGIRRDGAEARRLAGTAG